MRHLTFSILLIAAVCSPTRAHSLPLASAITHFGTHLEDPDDPERISGRPPASLPIGRQLNRYVLLDGLLRPMPDHLTDAELLQRIGAIYDYQARIVQAMAAENYGAVETLLHHSLSELQALLLFPEVVAQPRFQDAYRTVLAEYERFYDAPADTLMLPFGDIFAVRAEIFHAMDLVDEPLLGDVSLPSLGPVTTTIPMTMNRLVEQSIAYLLQSPERHVYNWLSRAQTYFPMIERILAEEGVPDELKYLAMIESGLNPRARSWASAGGMWQFMAATGAAYGLQVNSWVDERMDPEKATRAAARHLRDLYEQYGRDWHLALAGYNCSPRCVRGAMSRAQSRLGRTPTFWDVYNDLPRETRNYVPMFIATALVASNPEAFGLDMSRVRPGPEYSYHYVPVHGFLSIDELARMAATDEATIRALNPELRRAQIPPTQDGYYVRIPNGSYERFARAYSELPPSSRQAPVEYVVRRGDTLGRIAGQHGVTVSDLMSANNLRNTTIRINQRLIVPVQSSYQAGPLLASLDGMEVLTINYGRTPIRPIAADASASLRQAPAPAQPATPVVAVSTVVADAPAATNPGPETTRADADDAERAETRIVYTVRRGDNLTEIARKYGATVADVMSWNNLRNTQIQIGQRLHLFGSNPEPAAATTIEYRVRRGDTLGDVSRRHGVTVADLRTWNGLRSDVIRIGQRLVIHTSGAPTAPVTYRVQRGDTLSSIARRHGVSVNDLMSWNSLRSTTIRPGQTLRVGS